MIDRDGYPAGVPCWIDLALDDPLGVAPFYAGLLGWQLEDRMPPDAPGHYLMATIRDRVAAGIGSRPPEVPGATGWTTYVWVDDADASAARAQELGGRVLLGPMDVFDAGRMALVADPEGAVIGLWQARRHRGAVAVNEHGGWNFSGLHARDTEAALAFYGGLFGWEGSEPDPGQGGVVLLRMPGYGDHLEALQPGTLARMEEMGAPEGFADAIGWLVPAGPDEDPHWDVTFGVDDADAAAARAWELGGEVTVEPHDMPWVRTTVIRDPAGIELTASQFVPPEHAS